ncbi:MAG TPA: Xaa-Pro peptidase family protein [Gaiellaceae bacterium]|nr:Xaa-Pro peptidase family protein [Gaiellaceae bacterium]
MTRLARLAAALQEPLLVTSRVNVRYLVGLDSSNAALLVEPDGDTTLFTDSRYARRAEAVEGVTFSQTKRNVIGELAERLSGRRIGIEAATLTVAQWETLRGGGVEPVATNGAVEELRVLKEEGEIDAMRAAAALSDRMFEALATQRFTGRTERELAWWIEVQFRELGAQKIAFDPIVASDVNGASPHAELRDTPIPEGTLVTVDAGCVVDGYCSDCTRTFATGELPEQLARMYAVCRQAQQAGLDAIGPGIAGRDADAASRNPIAEAGYGEYYGHGMGHGVGIEVHEAPTLRPESEDVLVAGQVVSVEPGIYVPQVGGVRIEDLVLVTEAGGERLTTFTKDLLTVE